MAVTARTGEEGRVGTVQAAQRWLGDRPAIVLMAILLALLAATGIQSPGALAPHSLALTLLTAASLGVLAAGQMLVIFTAGIDLSVSATATAAAYLMTYYGTQGTGKAVAIGLAVALLIGLVNGIGVGIFNVQPLIMTLGVSGIVMGLLTLRDTASSTSTPLLPGPIHQLGSSLVLGYLPVNVLLIWLPLSILLIYVFPRSGLGRMIYAVGDNPLACRLSGVRVWQVQLAAYTICGFLSGVAGIMYAGYFGAVDLSLASAFLLPSIAAVVIGGTSIFGGSGSYTGTILGALILTVLDNLLVLRNVSQPVRQMLYGAIVLTLAWVYARVVGSQT